MRWVVLSFALFFSIFCVAQTPQAYTSFQGTHLNLFKWEGSKVMILSSSAALNPTAMANWTAAMDATYNYYALCTGREPQFNVGGTYINNRTTIADVPATCGAGCSYLGATGIEVLHYYFDNTYTRILNDNQYDQVVFYEFGRNFWFYDGKLRYKANDPIVTGYAVFMRFMSIEYIGVNGAPFNETLPYPDFVSQVKDLLPSFLADNSLNWGNTLGIGAGVPSSGWGATDLFASFCFYLKENYGGQNWVKNVWKYAGLRPDAVTTQDAVDNFIIASSQAANVNLTSLFQTWKWPVSSNAITVLNALFAPTPVTLTEFRAVANNCNAVTISWKTTQEINNKGFYIEQSADGNKFTGIGFVAGNGNTGVAHSYQFGADNLPGGKTYFRLKQMDFDGHVSFSKVIVLANNCGENLITLYPNPVSNWLRINGLTESKNNIRLVNSSGLIVRNWINTGQRVFDFSALPDGNYFLMVNDKIYRLVKAQ